MSLVIDASVAAKWVLPEPGSERAEKLRTAGEPLIAPSLVLAEVGNAAWKRFIKAELTPADAEAAVRIVAAILSELIPMEQFAIRATALAVALRHPIYDCFYLALAEREKATLVTADARLLAAAKKAKLKVRQL